MITLGGDVDTKMLIKEDFPRWLGEISEEEATNIGDLKR
jgi:hypothetical protein